MKCRSTSRPCFDPVDQHARVTSGCLASVAHTLAVRHPIGLSYRGIALVSPHVCTRSSKVHSACDAVPCRPLYVRFVPASPVAASAQCTEIAAQAFGDIRGHVPVEPSATRRAPREQGVADSS
jgi:hypothetical protein